MGYYTRVLSKIDDFPSHAMLLEALLGENTKMKLLLENGSDRDWTNLLLTHSDDEPIAAIERNPIVAGSLGADELAEFVDALSGTKPDSAIPFLLEFFRSAKTIFALQHLSGSHRDGGFEALQCVRTCLWQAGPAILQADGEGFTNEEGYQINWEFSDGVEGLWWMAVLQNGRWLPFQMDLGNAEQRSEFLAGRVPPGTVTRG